MQGVPEHVFLRCFAVDVYIAIFFPDATQASGGAAIYISKDLKVTDRAGVTLDADDVESYWIEINTNNKRHNIIIGCIYRHPCAKK